MQLHLGHHASDADKILPITGAAVGLGLIITTVAAVYHVWLGILLYMP